MSERDEIPADVMKAAREAGIAVFDASKFSSGGDPIKVIARAILAERRRCAEIARGKAIRHPIFVRTGASEIGDTIAHLIERDDLRP